MFYRLLPLILPLRRFFPRPGAGQRVGVRGGLRAAGLLLFCFALVPARAAEPVAAQQPAPVSADELERLVYTLQDDTARARLVEELRGLIAAQRGVEKERPAAPAFFGQLSQQIDAFSGEVLAGIVMLVDAPRLFGWAHEQMFDVAARRLWSEAALAFVLIFGGAVLAE